MKLSEVEKKDLVVPEPPKYPYGLKISLGPEELEKLGYEDVPQVGSEKKMYALVEVVEVSVAEEKGDDKDHRVVFQIKELEFKKEEKKEKSSTQVMYGE